MKARRTMLAIAGAAVLALAFSSAGATRPAGTVQTLAGLFGDNVFLGGQTPPRLYRWVNDRVALFLQLDSGANVARATSIRYIGIGVKGTFCAETQPDRGFTHFHRLSAPTYGQGHGGPPGTEGYWLMWVAVDEFTGFDGRRVLPGVDYDFQPTPPPSCGGAPAPAFSGPNARSLTRADIRALAAVFQDNPLQGGQTPPRLYRWVNGEILITLQFDKKDPAKATKLDYIGVAKRGIFCSTDRGTGDFTLFNRLKARSYAKSVGGAAREPGFWQLSVAVGDLTMPWGKVAPGVDRKFLPIPAPECGGGGAGGGSGNVVEVRTVANPDPAKPFAFDPADVRVPVGTTVRWVNGDGSFHTVTSTDSVTDRRANGAYNGTLGERGQVFTRRFDRAGTFSYFCQPHSDFMFGTIRVG
jgi:plastocyanin